MARRKTFAPGDDVAYSAAFLRSTGMITGDAPMLRGRVIQTSNFDEEQLCVVSWTLNGRAYPYRSNYYGDGFGRVIAANLTLVEKIGEDSALST